MNNNQLLTRKLINLKSKIMIKKIDKLYLICKMLFKNSVTREIKSLEVIKEQYVQMYNKLIETGQYEKYRKVEDIIIKEIAKIELDIDQYIYNTINSCEEIIKGNIESIYQSRNYQNFNNLDQEMQHIGILKEILRLYSPYISKKEIEKIQEEITKLKFDMLYRKQVEQLIYENGGDNSSLVQYDSENEKASFERLLEKKIDLVKNKSVNPYEDSTDKIEEEDELFKMPIEQVLSDSKLLERLIIIDMKRNPYNYINLVKAKIFNAHLCNIGNNPFEKKVYITKEQLHRLGYWKYGRKKFEGLKTNKVNYSLLNALLKNIITDENICIFDCENLYRKFGFECNPILVNIGQQCVKMILDEVKESQEYINILSELEKKKVKRKGQYCKMDFEGLEYEFENEDKDTENLFDEVISKRNINLPSSMQRESFFSKKQEIPKKEEKDQERKEKIKKEGIITKDIDIIVLLIKDIIEPYNDEVNKLKEKLKQELQKEKEDSYSLWPIKCNIERLEEIIKREEGTIEWLEEIKNKNEKLTLEETRKLLLTINDVYNRLHIKHNVRNILPLENMGSENSYQVYLAPIPKESGSRSVEISHSFLDGSRYEDRYYHKSDLKPLWEKYKREFIDLGIDVKKYSPYYGSTPHFEICVNLDDISDLPIDYEKVKLLTEEELQEIIKREEGNERE